MQPHLEQANHDLFEGNRSAVETALRQRIARQPATAEDLWLLANATEDETERLELLQRVRKAGKQPYARLAADILDREDQFAREMERGPGWQMWFVRNLGLLRTIIITGVILAGALTLLLAWQNQTQTTINQQTAAATQTAVMQQGLLAATQTAVAVSDGDMSPFGRIEVIEWATAAQQPVTQADGKPVALPPNSTFLAIRYRFTCGSRDAFCAAVPAPDDQIFLRLSGAANPLPYTGLIVSGQGPVEPLAANSSTTAWLVFPVPNGQSPVELIIVPDERTGQPEIIPYP